MYTYGCYQISEERMMVELWYEHEPNQSNDNKKYLIIN